MSVQQSNENNAEQLLYEKKYFDCLPNDLDSDDVTYEEATHELVKSSGDGMSPEHDSQDNGRRVNSRKFKRDLQRRAKRQSIFYVPVPLTRHSPYPNVDFFFTHNFPAYSYPVASSLQSRVSGSNTADINPNPWSAQSNPGKFRPPYNFYLPARPSNK